MAEHRIVAPKVTGSSPVGHPTRPGRAALSVPQAANAPVADATWYSGLSRVPDPDPTAPVTTSPQPLVNVGVELYDTAPKISSFGCAVVTVPEDGLVLLPLAVRAWSIPVSPANSLALAVVRPEKPGYVAVIVSPADSAATLRAEQTKSLPWEVIVASTV